MKILVIILFLSTAASFAQKGDEIRLTASQALETRCPKGNVYIRHNYHDGLTEWTESAGEKESDWDYYVCEPTQSGQKIYNACLEREKNDHSVSQIEIKFYCAIGIYDDKHWDWTPIYLPPAFLSDVLKETKKDFEKSFEEEEWNRATIGEHPTIITKKHVPKIRPQLVCSCPYFEDCTPTYALP